MQLIEAKITKRTKAILPFISQVYTKHVKNNVNIKKYKIPVIEDACQGILSSYNKKNSGTWGVTGCFSLHPLKI